MKTRSILYTDHQNCYWISRDRMRLVRSKNNLGTMEKYKQDENDVTTLVDVYLTFVQ